MQDIIKKIIEIDRMAQKITDDTIALRKEAEASIEADKQELREKYIEKARHRIGIMTETEENFLKEALATIDKRHTDVAADLNSVYEQNRQGWVNEIYTRVIGG